MPNIKISQRNALLFLRLGLAIVFLAHALVRISNGTIPRFAGYLESKGFVFGSVIVWMITAFEILGSVLLVIGYFKRFISAGFIFMLIVGIAIIHWQQGWFVGEHGSGGIEYSFILIIAFIVVAAEDTIPVKRKL